MCSFFFPGNIQSNRDRLLRCCIAVLKGIDAFCQNKDGGSLKEIHLVNNNHEVTDLLKQVFDIASRTQGAGGQNKQCSKGKGGAREKYEKICADAVGNCKQEDTSVRLTTTQGNRSNFTRMPLPSHSHSDDAYGDDDDIYDKPDQAPSQIKSEKEDHQGRRSSEKMSQTKKNERPPATETKETEKQPAGNLMIIAD